jgi:DUF971 family protein
MAVATSPRTDPKAVQVNLTSGTGVDIEWKDGHRSHYTFTWLRDACPCALCDDERAQSGRAIGSAPTAKPGELPMFRESPKPTQAAPVGKYAVSFKWSDGHQHGIYSWEFLRKHCPCTECKALQSSAGQ